MAEYINEGWVSTVQQLMAAETTVSPRGMKTRELLNHTLAIDMQYPVLTVAERKLGYRFLHAEAAWILEGDNRVETIAPYSKLISQFSDDGIFFFGAYGPKVVDQLQHVVRALHADNDTRQAVINIWREKPGSSKDVPCTLSCQFLLREQRLHCVVTMRSSDIWLGVPYDLFNFSVLSAYVLLLLSAEDSSRYANVQLGTLYNNAGSRHVYETNFERASKINYRFHYKECPSLFVDLSDAVSQCWTSPKTLIDELWSYAKTPKP